MATDPTVGYPLGFAWFLSGRIPQLAGIAGFAKFAGHQIKKYIYKILKINGQDQINIGDEFAKIIDRAEFTKRCLILLAMGRDKPDGEVQLREEMKKIAEMVDTVYVENPLTHLNKVISVHPLGGCPMGNSPETGL